MRCRLWVSSAGFFLAVTTLESNKGADNDGANNNINPELATCEWSLRAINDPFYVAGQIWRGTWLALVCSGYLVNSWTCLELVWRERECHDSVILVIISLRHKSHNIHQLRTKYLQLSRLPLHFSSLSLTLASRSEDVCVSPDTL